MASVPKVSIITPLFNREQYIQKSWESIKNQTFEYWEWIVVDDHSKDRSFELVQEWAAQDSRIRPLKRNRSPKGAPTCRNIGLNVAKGDYVIFFDSDDLLAPFCLEFRLNKFQMFPKLDFLVFGIILKEESNPNWKLWNIDADEPDLERFIRRDAVWQTMGPIYRTAFLRNTAGFQEGLPFRQDYEFHVRILLQAPNYKTFLKNADCFLLRHSNESISQNSRKAKTFLDVDSNIYQQFLQLLNQHALANTKLTRLNLLMLYHLAVDYAKQRSSKFREVLNIVKKENVFERLSFDFAVVFVRASYIISYLPESKIVNLTLQVLQRLLVPHYLLFPMRTMNNIDAEQYLDRHQLEKLKKALQKD